MTARATELPGWKLAYRLEEAAEATGLSRETLYRRIAEGKLTAKKDGRLTVIEADEIRRYLSALPVAEIAPSR